MMHSIDLWNVYGGDDSARQGKHVRFLIHEKQRKIHLDGEKGHQGS